MERNGNKRMGNGKERKAVKIMGRTNFLTREIAKLDFSAPPGLGIFLGRNGKERMDMGRSWNKIESIANK